MTTLEIEWRHLEKDGRTCLRCSDTPSIPTEKLNHERPVSLYR